MTTTTTTTTTRWQSQSLNCPLMYFRWWTRFVVLVVLELLFSVWFEKKMHTRQKKPNIEWNSFFFFFFEFFAFKRYSLLNYPMRVVPCVVITFKVQYVMNRLLLSPSFSSAASHYHHLFGWWVRLEVCLTVWLVVWPATRICVFWFEFTEAIRRLCNEAGILADN